jgi:3-oxoacyl-[acyl-carrier-protein] synthase-1
MDRAASQAGYAAGDKNFFKDPKVIGGDGMPIRYAPVFPVHDVRNLEARFQKLVAAAITDLLSQVPNTDRYAQIVLHLPSWLKDENFADKITGWPSLADWSPSLFHVVWSDQASFAKVLSMGIQAQQSNPDRDVILISADTFMYAVLLDLLSFNNRILSKSQPHGIIPSEAAIALRLTTETRLSFETGLAWVDGQWDAVETQDVARPTDMLGDALATVMRDGSNHANMDRLISDTNGERWRAEELGMALSRATNLNDDLTADFETPASHFGFCGETMPALMIALAMSPGPTPVAQGTQTQRHLIVASAFSGQRDGIAILRDTRQEGQS